MSNISDRIKYVQGILNPRDLSKVAYDAVVKATPIKTGNAKRSTYLRGTVIDADYDYATKLNEGYSKQAPQGMYPAGEQAIREYIYSRTGIRTK